MFQGSKTALTVYFLSNCAFLRLIFDLLKFLLDDSKRMNSHRFDIFQYPDNFTNVSMHLNENGHAPNVFAFAQIDIIEAEWPRLLKETYWMNE